MAGPFRETALSELPFLVSDQHDSFDQRSCRDDVAVVDLEPHHLQVVFDIAREDELNTLDLFREQFERIAPIDIPGDLLTEISDIADSLLPIDQTGHRVATSVRGFNNGASLMIGDVAQPKRDAVPSEDMPYGDAERRSGKLDEREHGYDGSGKKLQYRGKSRNEPAIRISYRVHIRGGPRKGGSSS